MRPEPGTQQRPEFFHGIDMNFMESVAVFIARIFATPMAHRPLLIPPLVKPRIDVVFVRINLCSWRNGGPDQRLDGLLLDIGQHLDDHFAATLNHAEYGRLFLFQRAASTRPFQPVAPSTSPFFSPPPDGPYDQPPHTLRHIRLRPIIPLPASFRQSLSSTLRPSAAHRPCSGLTPAQSGLSINSIP